MRLTWLGDAPMPVQWNHVRTNPNVLRGIHVHVTHWDLLVVSEGEATIGLVDLRKKSNTYRKSRIVRMRGDAMSVISIPPGIAHGFHFPRGGVFIYALSHYWDPIGDEFACRWDDPALALDWGCVETPVLSPRDESAGSLEELLRTLKGKAGWCESD